MVQCYRIFTALQLIKLPDFYPCQIQSCHCFFFSHFPLVWCNFWSILKQILQSFILKSVDQTHVLSNSPVNIVILQQILLLLYFTWEMSDRKNKTNYWLRNTYSSVPINAKCECLSRKINFIKPKINLNYWYPF